MTSLLIGWVEVRGVKVTSGEVLSRFRDNPMAASEFGGEFFISVKGCSARDTLGIIPGNIPPGTIACNEKIIGSVECGVKAGNLSAAIREAVRLRSDQGVVALSGGVDSTLIAALAGLPCICVGTAGSRDTECAERAAHRLGLDFSSTRIRPDEVEDAVILVLNTIPCITPVNVAIATTQYFITLAASEGGYSRVLTGQGADELFGGYSRYVSAQDIDAELARDFLSLRQQADRDQSVAALNRVLLSMPYLDLRVVRTAEALPASRKVSGSLRKIALREVAQQYIPADLAWADKKAMQYGSGVWKEIRHLAKRGGFSRVADYLDDVCKKSDGHPLS